MSASSVFTLVSRPACFAVHASLSSFADASWPTSAVSRPKQAATSAPAAVTFFAASATTSSCASICALNLSDVLWQFSICLVSLWVVSCRLAFTPSTLSCMRATFACMSFMMASCAPEATWQASRALSHVSTWPASVARTALNSASTSPSSSPQVLASSSRLAILVADAPAATSTFAFSSVSCFTSALSAAVWLASCALVASVLASARFTSSSRSSITVLKAPPCVTRNSCLSESSLTCEVMNSVVSFKSARVALRDFSQRPTSDSRSSIIVFAAPDLTRHSSLSAVSAFAFAAAAAEVAASVARVALSEVAQRSTLDLRSPMTVSCAPFAETHVSVASRDALS